MERQNSRSSFCVLAANFVTPELISDFWTVKKESEIEIYNALNISASMIKGTVLYLKEKIRSQALQQ
jgi:hypothetical protein